MTAAQLAAIVPGCREVRPGRWVAPCPNCGGSGRSSRFGFEDKDDRIVAHCFVCGDAGAVVQALGLRWRDLFHDEHRMTRAARREAERERRAREIVREWRKTTLTETCARPRYFTLLEYQATLRLQKDRDDDLAWDLLAHTYGERPKLQDIFDRLTSNDDAATICVWREHRERGRRVA